jgi:ParB-like nuclease domain
MRKISTEGFEKPKSVSAGAAPILQWLQIGDLIVDPAYQRPIVGKGRRNVNRIAREFSWSCFAPVVVAPLEGGKFAIIDGQHRTTAAALVGFESVPCQIVIAAHAEQAAAFKAINGIVTPISRMALHAAALVAQEPGAVQLANVCARAEVELLRYPVPIEKQAAGQTMAIGAIAQCLKHYGEETLITALQCVTQTTNNQPGTLSARIVKALCDVLDGDTKRRDSGLALLEAFDAIDLIALQSTALVEAAVKKISPVQALAERIRSELDHRMPRKAAAQVSVRARSAAPVGGRTSLPFSRKAQGRRASQSNRM